MFFLLFHQLSVFLLQTADFFVEIQDVFSERKLPQHPLVARGYPSIGCYHCTREVAEGEELRAGRWEGEEKTECGIHRASWAFGQ